ncbi:MAG: hypothetical protein CMB53_05080 [Euryarchaeota archaeon]|nr:hypothetical protein [Euryarchaeota archaeon]
MGSEDSARQAMFVSCTECSWERELKGSSVISGIEQSCPTCQGPVAISIGRKTKVDTINLEAKQLDEEYLIELDADTDARYSSLVSKVMPSVVVAMTVAAVADSEYKIDDHAVLIDELKEKALDTRTMLEDLEERQKITGASRVSVGFPDNDESAKRFIRMYLGGDTRSRTMDGGLFQDFGLIEVSEKEEEERVVRLGKGMKAFSEVQPKTDAIEKRSYQRRNTYDIEVPVWYSDEDCEKLAQAIADRAELEKRLMYSLLVRIKNFRAPTIYTLIDSEFRLLTAGEEEVRKMWGIPDDSDWETLDDEEAERVRKKITNGMIATLGRMRELRLVIAQRKGRSNVYYITDDIGKRLLDKWEPQE